MAYDNHWSVEEPRRFNKNVSIKLICLIGIHTDISHWRTYCHFSSVLAQSINSANEESQPSYYKHNEVIYMVAICIGIAAVVVIVLFFVWFFSYYNKIIQMENRIDNAWAQIDVQLKRRADLIPNLLESVKGYMKHEKDVLESVTKARTSMMNAQSPQESMKADNMLTGALKTLFAVSENYPDLKANQNFLQLQDELTHTEDKVSYARQHYNDSVLNYNNIVETFPGVIFANMMNKKEREMLQIEPEARELPKVSFD